MNIMWYQEI